MQREAAETLALTGLGWLVGNDELLPVFLGSTGSTEADLRTGAGDSDFLASVLDFLMLNDTWIIAFCDASGLDYGDPARARAALPGGEAMHWT